MPKFYVGVVFQGVTEDNFYIGGEPHPRFIRIWVDHIARTFQPDEMRVNFFTYVNKLLAPFIADSGFDWDVHVEQTQKTGTAYCRERAGQFWQTSVVLRSNKK